MYAVDGKRLYAQYPTDNSDPGDVVTCNSRWLESEGAASEHFLFLVSRLVVYF